jgi:hypothetical protein
MRNPHDYHEKDPEKPDAQVVENPSNDLEVIDIIDASGEMVIPLMDKPLPRKKSTTKRTATKSLAKSVPPRAE